MRVLVTGGYGFMGSWVVDHLMEVGHEVFVLSKSNEGKKFLSKAEPKFIKADLANDSFETLMQHLPPMLDVCVHTASLNDPFIPAYDEKALQVNIRGTQVLLKALRRKYAHGPLFIYASTFHVYGKSKGALNESSPLEPISEYALTHALAEEYTRFFHRAYELPCIILRCVNGYGVPKCLPFGKWYLLFHDLCKTAFEDGAIVLESPANTERDFIWMGDVAKVINELMPRRDLAGKTFNLASGKTMSLKTLAGMVAVEASKALDTEVAIIENSAPNIEDSLLRVDCSALKAVLDYKFSCKVSEEAEKTFALLNEI